MRCARVGVGRSISGVVVGVRDGNNQGELGLRVLCGANDGSPITTM